MSEQFQGKVEITKNGAGATITLDGFYGNLTLGSNGQDGDLLVRNKDGKNTIHLDGDHSRIYLNNSSGQTAIDLEVKGSRGDLTLGGAGSDGNLFVKTDDDKLPIHLNAYSGNIYLGCEGRDGDLLVRNKDGKDTIHLNGDYGNILLGSNGQDGDLIVRNKDGKDTIHLDGDKGDIVLKNGDCAEDFDIAVAEEVEPGTVMVIDEEGALRPSTEAYDKKVAGVVSGAGDLKPGLILDKKPESTNRMPIALMGKVYCKVDAEYTAIEVGDLLTTSPTPGHAMKATDPLKAFGCVLGKALGKLENGTGMIPVLIALQ